MPASSSSDFTEPSIAPEDRQALVHVSHAAGALCQAVDVDGAAWEFAQKRAARAKPIKIHHRSLVTRPTRWRGGVPRMALVTVFASIVGLIGFSRLDRVRGDSVETVDSGATLRTVTLADQSTITLAPHSRIRVTETSRERTVHLEGHGYFVVRNATTVPFTVRAGTVSVRVLGTTFEVRRSIATKEVHVAVIDGRLSVHSGDTSATMTAGTVLTAGDSGLTSTQANTVRLTEWTRGHLVFDDVPLPTLLSTLGEWYGVRFKVTDAALKGQRVSGDFKTDALQETLRGLETVLDASIHLDGATVTVRKRVTSPAPAKNRSSRDTLSSMMEVGR